MNNIAIRAEEISKQYDLASAKYRHDTLRDQLMDSLKSVFRRDRNLRAGEKFWALKDVSFEIEQGEILGIIGQNGAGKSTLLKILSRITEPTLGRGEVFGRVGSLLEVGTGFHPELTGRENIYLNGAIIGMRREEIRRCFDAIVDFAEIEKFIDLPVKRYSSGMYVRLAFAVSAHLKPEILLVDEVLSVGDLQFQRKCMVHAEELRKSGTTILFVSHNMFSIKAICNRVIVLSKGRVRFDGSPADAIELYESDCKVNELEWGRQTIGADSSQWPVYVKDIETYDESGQPRNLFDYGERIRISLKFEVRRPVRNPNFLVSFIRSDEIPCCNFNTAMDGFTIPLLSDDGVIELLTPPIKLVSESYKIYILIRDESFESLYSAQTGKSFHVRHHVLNPHFGVFHEPGEWFMPGMAAGTQTDRHLGGIQQ
ncbi:MAG TPA: ABC transporter ATP-binding protein [Geobacteraceae bacterium]|nr:ABC transporter ATP-binding protein [Geobacteraceae bacterium]